MQTRLHMSCIEMDVLPCDWAYDAQKMSWTHLKSFAGLDSDISSEKPSNLSFWIYIAQFCVEFEWNSEKLNMVYVIIIMRYLSRRYQKLSLSYYKVFVKGFAQQFGTRG